MTDVPAVQETVAGAFHKHGKVDAVVSNADYGLFGCAKELTCCKKLHRMKFLSF